jgi:hypothetical protein
MAFSAGSALGPFNCNRSPAVIAVSPLAGSTLSRLATSSAGSAYHRGAAVPFVVDSGSVVMVDPSRSSLEV